MKTEKTKAFLKEIKNKANKTAIGLDLAFENVKKAKGIFQNPKTAKAVLEIDVFAKAKTKTSLRSFAFANYRSFLLF